MRIRVLPTFLSVWLAIFAFATLVACPPAFGQLTTADVVGTVRDATGGVVPNAKVTLTEVDQQLVRTATTDNSGDFTFSLLQSGNYRMQVEAPGFGTYKQEAFTLDAGSRRRIDATLSVAAATKSVNVTAAPPALDTDNTALSTV